MCTVVGIGNRFTLAIALCVWPVAAHGQAPIRWRSGIGPIATRAPGEAARRVARLAGVEGTRHIVVQFSSPVTAAQRAALVAARVTLLRHVGENAFFATVVGGRASPRVLSSVANLADAREIATVWKLHPTLAAGRRPVWAVVDETPASDPTMALYVLFHGDVPLHPDGRKVIQGFGGTVRAELPSVNGMVVELAESMIGTMAGADRIQYIEPALPQWDELNDQNRLWVGADVVQAAPYNLDGSGVTVMVYDAGRALLSHVDFAGRLISGDTTPVMDHSTHVACTIGGNGSAGGGLWRGMAPGVDLLSYGFQATVCSVSGAGCATNADCPVGESCTSLLGDLLYANPGDLEADYASALALGADVANNSIGTNTCANGLDCTITGDYGVTSALIDAIVGGSLGAPIHIVWANGNERACNRCQLEGVTTPAGYHSTPPPSCAKNPIAVGAVNANDDTIPFFTSFGPCDDGRLKPDIVAPGAQSDGDTGVTSCSADGDTLYTVKQGTSMATPTVSGLAALLLQDFRIQFPARPDLRNATLKALLIHNAQDITNPGPDYQSGYGSVRIQPTIDFLRLGDFLEDAVANLQTNTLFINVNPGDPQLKITLVWDDAPGTPNVDPALINNLDLVVTSPSMVQQFPWTLDPLNPALPAVRTQADTLNNVEQVVVDAPQAGLWRVDVVGTNVPVGPQGYSLTATPSLPGCVLPGTVSLDRQAYACDGTVMLEVADCDANINDAIVETVDVALTSVTEPAPGETVTLTETAAASGVFRGSIGLSPLDSAGVLHIVDGDTVTATYGTAAGDAVNGATLFLSPQPTNLGVSKACADCHGHDGSGNTAADIRGFSAAALAASAQGFVSHPAPVGRQDVKYPTLTAQDFNDMEAFLAVPSATGVVDCLEPVVFGVLTTNTGPQWTDVTFNTNESATSVVRYGLSCASLTQAAVESTPATVHTLTLTGLSELTTYFYTVDATDTAGNTVTDDNAGSCYAFSTTLAPDFFTERFQSADGDLDNLAITFVPNGSTNFYAACAESITVLPVDPIGGAALTLPDDGFATVTLGAGTTVSLYGTAYNTFHVGSNGYVTFTQGDTAAAELLANHFDLPRISALFDDLDPGIGGSVSWLQLADRVVVTWENVPELASSNANTFQIEMIFDGRIRLSYLAVAATDGLAGLSEGLGVPAGFVETDLSTTGPGCANGRCPAGATARVTVNLEIDALDPGPITRDVNFTVTDCPTSGVQQRTLPIGFVARTGTAVLDDLLVDPLPDWISVREGHTLLRRTPLAFDGCNEAVVDLVGTAALRSGDFQTGPVTQDNLVDAVDFSILSSTWNQLVDKTLSTGADVTGDGVQDTADFTALQINALTVGDAPDGCTMGAEAGLTPIKGVNHPALDGFADKAGIRDANADTSDARYVPLDATAVDLTWAGPVPRRVARGAVFDMVLVAVPADPDPRDRSVAAMDVLLQWDPTRIAFESLVDDPTDTWMRSELSDDSALDGLNSTFADGDARFTALAPPGRPATVTAAGLPVASFRFRALQEARIVDIHIAPSLGSLATTRVFGSNRPNQRVTGSLTDAAVTVIPTRSGDEDGDFDLADFSVFQDCFSGVLPAAPQLPLGQVPLHALPDGCVAFDYDGDGDVDHSDLSFLVRLSTGPAR